MEPYSVKVQASVTSLNYNCNWNSKKTKYPWVKYNFNSKWKT